MIRFFLFFMTAWAYGAGMFLIIAVADLLFSRNWKAFLSRLPMVAIWPWALVTKRGRDALFHVFQETQQ